MKSVLNISCGECQTHLIAFVHGDGTPLMRRRISRHLDHCSVCYSHYRRELELKQQLSREVRLIGGTDQPDFTRVWVEIQTNMEAGKSPVPRLDVRYGLAMLGLMLAILAPLTLGNQNLPLEMPPTQPAPLVVHMTPNTTASTITETTVAFLTDESQVTPEASQRTAGPSVQDVVNTP